MSQEIRPFTYIIRSRNAESTTVTNDVKIRLNGLPSMYNTFKCEVVSFFINAIANDLSGTVIELRAVEGMDLQNGRDSKGNALSTIAFTNTNNTFPQSTYCFECGNFNNRTCRFQLYDETNTLLAKKSDGTAFAKDWILVLQITPIN